METRCLYLMECRPPVNNGGSDTSVERGCTCKIALSDTKQTRA